MVYLECQLFRNTHKKYVIKEMSVLAGRVLGVCLVSEPSSLSTSVAIWGPGRGWLAQLFCMALLVNSQMMSQSLLTVVLCVCQ